MKSTKAKSHKSQKSQVTLAENSPILGRIAAVILALLSILQLLAISDVIGSLAEQFNDNNGLAVFVIVIALFSQILAIPFLLRLKISDLAKMLGGILTVIAPWVWTMVLIWSVGSDGSAAQFGIISAIKNEWWLLALNIFWLAFSLFVVRQLGLNEVWKNSIKIARQNLRKNTK